MKNYIKTFLLLAVFFGPALVFGENIATNQPLIPIHEEGEDRFFYEFMNMLTTLGLIVAAIFLISWFLRRMVNTRIQQTNTISLIKIVERRSLSPKAFLYLVEVHDKQFLIGETVNGMSNLGEFPIEPEESSLERIDDTKDNKAF